MRRAQYLEYLVEAFLAHNVAHTHIFGVLSWDSNGEIALGDLQDEVLFLLAFDGAGFDRLDQCSTVVWIDDGVSDLENHQIRAPFTSQS